MLCSNCGHENPAMNRFCGMCGTPLPQKPITAPGAQSTLGFTRLPIEAPHATASTLSGRTKATAVTPVSAATHSGPESGAVTASSQTSVAEQPLETSPAEENYFTQAEEAESLEQFIAGFHYKPPSEEDEVTMTGDKAVVDSGADLEPAVSSSLSEEPAQEAVSSDSSEEPAQAVNIPAEVEERPQEEAPYVESKVIEPPPFANKGVRTETPERSRFLDVGEPATQEVLATPAPIGGPSFLGLSDTPVSYQDTGETAPHSHWRAWLALIVILVFAGLGYLEWRAEKNQSSNGPMEIMKMQIERLKGKKGAVVTPAPSSGAASQAAPSGAQPQPGSSGPDMQVVPGQKPQATTPDTGSKPAASPDKPANPGTSSTTSPSAPQAQAHPQNELATATQNTSAGTGSAASNEVASTGTTTASEASGKEPQSAKTAPGADDLAKAQNASDAAAASAWLWKAVAKGNPEAPVKLANMYIKGDGVPQNCEQALVLLRSAAAKQNAAASSRLGAMYANATCVPRDRVRAYEYMSSAVEANPNAAAARDFREQLWTHMTPQERSQAQKYRQ